MPIPEQPAATKKRGRKPGVTTARTVRIAIHPAMEADLLWLRDTHGWGGNGDVGDVARFVLFREMARLQEAGFIKRQK
jgi:hypothetical protein